MLKKNSEISVLNGDPYVFLMIAVFVFLAVAFVIYANNVDKAFEVARTLEGKWTVIGISFDPRSLETSLELERLNATKSGSLAQRTNLHFVRQHPDEKNLQGLVGLLAERPELGVVVIITSQKEAVEESLDMTEPETFLRVYAPIIGEVYRFFSASW